MATNAFDPTACRFPAAVVPHLPALQWPALARALRTRTSSDFAGNDLQHFKRGRYALYDAYLACGIGQQGALLAPAYHCRSMLDPAIRLGAEIGLYELTDALAPKLESVARCVAQSKTPVKAVLATHFFGFPQELRALQEFCASHGLALIEDCSHVSPGYLRSGEIGQAGHYSVFSPYKFVPSIEGGMLWRNEAKIPVPSRIQAPALSHQLKNFLRSMRQLIGRHAAADLDDLQKKIDARQHLVGAQGQNRYSPDLALSIHYHRHEEGLQSDAWSQWILGHTDFDHLARLRRKNYQAWVEALKDLPHAKSLYPVLPERAAPYMYPLLLDAAEPFFHALKRLGVPIWRWDDMVDSPCDTSRHYRLCLIHLPCHQALSAAQLDWMVHAVRSVLSAPAGTGIA